MITLAAIIYFGSIGIGGAMLLYALWVGSMGSVKAGWKMAGLGFAVYVVGMFVAAFLADLGG